MRVTPIYYPSPTVGDAGDVVGAAVEGAVVVLTVVVAFVVVVVLVVVVVVVAVVVVVVSALEEAACVEVLLEFELALELVVVTVGAALTWLVFESTFPAAML